MKTKDIYQHKEKLRDLFEKKARLYTEHHSFEDAQKAWKCYLASNDIRVLDDNRILHDNRILQEAWENWVYGKTSENFPESVIVVVHRRSKSYEGSYYDYLVISPELASAILTLGELPP